MKRDKLISKILFEKRALARVVFFATIDALLIVLSVFFAFWIRFEGKIPAQYFLNIGGLIILSLAVTLPVFYFFKLYYFSWQYVSAEDLVSLAKGVILSFLILTAGFFLLRDNPVFSGFPRFALFVTYFFVFFFCGGLRFAKRIYLQLFSERTKGKKERTLILGAGDAGEQILRSIFSLKTSPYLPIGFVDDGQGKQGALIHGLKVLGRIKDIPKIVKEKQIEGLIVAMPSVDSEIIHLAVEKAREAGLRKIKIVPSIDEIINGKISIGQLRQVDVKNLLGRESLSLDEKSIERFIENKTVLITGAAGSIGSELSRQIAKFKPAQLLVLDENETGIFNLFEELKESFPEVNKKHFVTDIKDKEKIEQIFSLFKPKIIFHAAAYKHVPLMEDHMDEAVKNNIFGTKILAESALKSGTESFVFISTDKAVNPTSVMGATKRTGEMVCQALSQKNKTKFISVRFGNVLDSRGSVIPIFREKIKKREPIQVTHPEMKRFFMVTSEACLLVMQAGAMGQGGEVFVLDMGDPIKIMDLAREMIKLSGLEPDKDIPIVFTEPRPGEKLFEEILSAEEGIIATKHQKIFIAKLSKVNQKKIDLAMEKLKKAIEKGDKKIIIKALEELIPNFSSTYVFSK